jgi:hypothetical protein
MAGNELIKYRSRRHSTGRALKGPGPVGMGGNTHVMPLMFRNAPLGKTWLIKSESPWLVVLVT